MYNNIPIEINPIETSTKTTCVNAFASKFSLFLRERRVAIISYMQASTIDV